ncbi:hypothetical protein CERSUDRAFT_109007 [Gelatoporia subvermispora B]|uniref:F-box domain-containing protein n=1 Tax=Ceriporiopsis subvermispora (strain B) TaxID=914234 RepID=M2QZS5_CERS8|nr:hypothetical protein CERSUDRAFT_109007 [Gelatoporia subvermispora B]
MSKRPLSSVSLPSSKRLHGLSPRQHVSTFDLSFDDVFVDELLLLVFSYLSWHDLCTIQRTNRNWARLALDNQLWKSLYLHEYGRSRLRGVRGFIGRTDGREIRPLPHRAQSEDTKDWKWMFRISSNWRTGRCSVEDIHTGPRTRIERPLHRLALPAPPADDSAAFGPLGQTYVLLAGNLTLTASAQPLVKPEVRLQTPTQEVHSLDCSSSRSSATTSITALALDQSPPSSQQIRLAVFIATGEFIIFSLDHQDPPHSVRQLTYTPTSRTARNSPITHAVYHHPLLVTLSHAFHLSIYDLSGGSVVHTQTLTSFTSYPPSSLVLSASTSGTYKLVLAYAVPVYPAHWSVGATELIISGREEDAHERMTVRSSRTARAVDTPSGWMDARKLRAMREQWARKVTRVADIQTDGKWVILAPAMPPSPSAPVSSSSDSESDSTSPSSSSSTRSRIIYTSSPLYSSTALQLYRLHFPSLTGGGPAPRLTFVRTLHGQTGPVCALAVADGRCVSLGVDGGMWVWDLEGGTGAEVTRGPLPESASVPSGDGFGTEVARGELQNDMADEGKRMDMVGRGAVVFDDRRIVSAGVDGVQVRRFDI